MYPNLRAELARNGMKLGDLADIIGASKSTVSLKMAGKSPFSYEDATKIRTALCPDKPLEYLMEMKEQE